MRLIDRYRRLTIWNKSAFLGSLASIIALILYLFPSKTVETPALRKEDILETKRIAQSSDDQGTNIVAEGNVYITYNVPQNVFDQWQKRFEEQGTAIEEQEARIRELTKKMEELIEDLAERSRGDELVNKAKEELTDGNLEEAKVYLFRSMERHIDLKDYRSARLSALSIKSINELQMNYHGVTQYEERAAQLRIKEEELQSRRTDGGLENIQDVSAFVSSLPYCGKVSFAIPENGDEVDTTFFTVDGSPNY